MDGRLVHAVPCGALKIADAMRGAPGGIYRLQIAHDDECPTLQTQRMDDCRCVPDVDVERWDRPTGAEPPDPGGRR